MFLKLKSSFRPAGDQPEAIRELTEGLQKGLKSQVLLGVTGSGKTYTVANVIQNLRLPTLVISHNKTLAAQLYQEFKEFFPGNAVSYFVSYYDYYQPEAYIPQTDTYIAKDADINEEIDKLRLLATSNIMSRRDVVVVASVSCIYNIGSPQLYQNRIIVLKEGETKSREDFLYQLTALYYRRSRLDFERGTFRLRGETVEIFLPYADEIVKIVWKDDAVAEITTRPVFGEKQTRQKAVFLYPAKHYLADPDVLQDSFRQIRQDLKIRIGELEKAGRLMEANRLTQRVNYDLEMIKELGYVNGIENYSRYFDGRLPGDPPYTLLDYFKHQYGDDFLIVIDESHMTVPQLRGMHHGDRSRKETLVDFGFRLPSCFDNRPLRFEEFLARSPRFLFVSATPDEWEIGRSENHVVEQLIRPTGLLDPEVEIRPTEGQVKNLIAEIVDRKKKGERVLVTTLTKKMAEDLASFLEDPGNTGETVKVNYLHADVDTLKRTDILADLRRGNYDVIVGINLLREGLDLPEVSLVAILDADKQGFLRSKISLIQTMGRAARHVDGKVILYADEESQAMKEALAEVDRRRQVQLEYNRKHNIIPKTISKPIRENLSLAQPEEAAPAVNLQNSTPGEIRKEIPKLKKKMREYARLLDFEKAARIRDEIAALEKVLDRK